MRHLWSALLLLCIGTSDLAAQAAPAPGSRVRVIQATSSLDNARARRAATQTGVLQAIDSASVTVQVGGQSMVYPLNTLTRIDASGGSASVGRGVMHGARRGATLGAVTVASLAVLGLAAKGNCESETCENKGSSNPMVGIAAAVSIGGAAGGLIGALAGTVSREIWTPVWTRPETISLGVDRGDQGGARVGLTLRF